jgi:hypothetical protein
MFLKIIEESSINKFPASEPIKAKSWSVEKTCIKKKPSEVLIYVFKLERA